MELQQLRYVVTVAETSNFTRAAERCLVVQSALSHQIARLERELGARLFDRTSRSVRLTPAGQAFLPLARQCLDAAERASSVVAAAVGEVRGRVSIGLISTVAAVDIPAALAEFRTLHPQVRVDLRVAPSDELVELVKQGSMNLAFLGLPDGRRPRGVDSREIARDRLIAVVPTDHELAGEDSTTLRRLATETFADLPAGTAGRAQSDGAFAGARLSRDVAFEVTSADYVVRLVRQGLAIALLPTVFAQRLTDVALVEVLDGPTRVEHVIWTPGSRTPAAAAFLAILGIAA